MAQQALRYTRQVPEDQVVELLYLDSQGRELTRHVVPDRIWFGRTDWFPEPQWLLDAFDVEHGHVRCFALEQVKLISAHNHSGVPDGRSTSISPF
ncbi:hypothetical protein [Marmoricola sp. URHB0036]|uniref:hypothetical protein n=1 Tax=Marmoricola sp. URHB0036 TaxID=1298863 RepID=UPI0012DC5AD3|nr:hypothetical protein [Marmoricola sp. URHB0036]